MSRLSIPVIFFVLLLSVNGRAQKKVETVTCPNIFLSGPAGVVNPGEVGNYNLTFKRLNLWARYTFNWSVKGGELVEGQGTEHARVKRGASTVTVSVTVSGQPKGCPSTFTEDGVYLEAPESVKILELQPDVELAEREIALLVSEHTKNPNNQIYILVGHLYGKASPEILKKQAAIRATLTKAGIPYAFITFKGVYAEAELMQFWRVPPGASNPTCKECEKLVACPIITVIEPQGVTNVGDTAEFKLNPSISKIEDLEFVWSVSSAGTIESGQGTNAITVRTDSKVDAKTLTATVSIKGLPKECENTAKGEAVLLKSQGDILLDEFRRIPLNDQRARLDSFVMDLIHNPTQIGYVVLNYKKGTKDSKVLKRVRFIKDHVFGVRKLAKDRLVILSEPSDRETTKIYRLPRDYADGFCSACKIH